MYKEVHKEVFWGDEKVLHSVITVIYKCGNIHRSAYPSKDLALVHVNLTFI